MNVLEVERDPERLEGLLKRAEGKDTLTAQEIEEMSEEYQRWCQFYGYIQTIAPGSSLSRRVLSAIQRGRAVIYGRGYSNREPFLQRVTKAYEICAPYIFLSISCGLLSGVLAAVLVLLRPSLAYTLLSEGAIESLASGHLWTEQLQGAGMLASTSILKNNITVAFTAFALGITGGVGTFAILAVNGSHLGSTFAAVYQYHMADELLTFISAHGPLELSIIFVSGGAGLAIGDSILHPGALPTKESLKRRSSQAFDIVILGAIGLFFAGFIEGLISPQPSIPLPMKIVIGVFAASVYWSLLVAGANSPFVKLWNLKKRNR